MTGAPDSTLAKAASVHLDCSVAEEACPLNLAPTASTTAALAMGDALAVACSKRAASRRRTLRARIQAGDWGGSCCCMSPM